LVSSSAESYPELDILRNYYFEKYNSNYNIWDYIRIIKYFDNSLFKMVQDWVPARTSLASGIVIKQTTLERNKYPVPQLDINESIITGSGIQMYQITGSSGGTMPNLFGETSSFYTGNNVVNITQSWTGATPSLLGPVAFTQSSQTEFFDGELSGSNILVTNGELNPSNPVKQPSTQILNYESTGSFATNPGAGQFFWRFASHQPPIFDGPAGLNELYINTTDLNGININEALQNLFPGDSITFTINYEAGIPS
jgi:hypothetical protein